MTDTEFNNWLKSPSAIRLVLIRAWAQVDGVETPIYMSAKTGYVSKTTDTPASQVFLPIASIGVLYTERLSFESDASLSAAEIEIDNVNGVRDNWFDYVWSNRDIEAWVGDPSWAFADFRPIFIGKIATISPKGRSKIGLKLRDKLQQLNQPLTTQKLGGTTDNKDALIPLSFGEVHNVTPLLIDPVLLKYRVHIGPIHSIVEVRDNGIPVAFTQNAAEGTFTLTYQSFGTITCTVQGDKPGATFETTCAKLVERMVTTFYGHTDMRFTSADIDATNFADFDSAHRQPMGLFTKDRLNILNACHMLTKSIGSQMAMTRLGKLRLYQLMLPPVGTPIEIHPQHMVDQSLAPVRYYDAVGSVQLAFAKNYTVQQTVAEGLNDAHRVLYAEEWLTTTKTDSATITKYKLLTDEPQPRQTQLLRRVEADAECLRLLEFEKNPRIVYEMIVLPEMLNLELGQAIKVFHPKRFGMQSGKVGMILSLAPNWDNGKTKVEFII